MTAKPKKSLSRRTIAAHSSLSVRARPSESKTPKADFSRFLSIGQAASFLGVSIDTLRNWEEQGKVTPQRSAGNVRRYTLTQLKKVQASKARNLTTITGLIPQGQALQEIITISSYQPSLTIPKYIKVVSIFGVAALALVILLTTLITTGYLVKPEQTKSLFANRLQSTDYSKTQEQQVLGTSSIDLSSSIGSAFSTILSPFNQLAQSVIQTIQPDTAKDLGFYQKSTDERFDQNEQAVLDLSSTQTTVTDKISQLQNKIADIGSPVPTTAPKRLILEDAFIGQSVFDSFGNIYPVLTTSQSGAKPSLGTLANRFLGIYANRFDLDPGGNLKIYGQTTLGDSGADYVKIIGRIANDIIPSTTGEVSLGDGDRYFKKGYINTIISDTGGFTSLSVGTNFTSAASTVNLINTTTTTLNIGGAATSVSLGASTGTTTINNNLSVTGSITTVGVNSGSGLIQGTGGLTLTGATSINASGSNATDIGTGTNSGTITIGNASTGDLALNDANWSVTGPGAATFSSGTFNGNLDMTSDLILNIGDTGTDFTSGGGLTLAGTLTANGDVDIGNAATDTLTLTSVIDSNLSFIKEVARTIQISDSTTTNTAGADLTLKGAAGVGTGAGGAIGLTTGAGGGTSGVSGALTLATGTAAAAANTGNITIDPGAATGGGTTGSLLIGNTNARTLTIGSSSATSVSITDDNWNVTGAGVANFVSVGATTAGTGAFTTLTSNNTTTIGNGSGIITGIGNSGGAAALNLTSGTGSQTFTSSVVSGTTTTSAFVFDATALTSGTGLYLTTDSITTGRLLDIATTGNTWTGNGTTNGLVNLASTSTAGTASSSDILLNIARSGANAQLAHTAYGLYSSVTNTNVTSGTNIAGYFSASGATTANYGLIVEAGNVGIGTTAPAYALDVNGTARLGATVVTGAITASTGSLAIGSSGTRFGTIWADTVDATNIAGTVTGGSTSNASWTINSGNTTDDTQNSSLAFERGNLTPNALIAWDATNKEFDFNSSINLTGTISQTTLPLLALSTSTAQTTGDIFDLTATYTPTAGGTQSAIDINLTNSPVTNANTLRGLDIGFTDAGTLANTIYGLYVDATTANASDTTYAAYFGGGNVGIGTTAPTQLLAVGSTSQFNVSSVGAVVAVGLNSGSGLIQGTGGLTLTGAASINASGANATDIGTGTNSGTITIGNASTGDLALNDANWNVTGAGVANFVSVGATTAGTGAFTTLISNNTTTIGNGSGVITGIGNSGGAAAINLTSGTGSQTFTSSVVSGTTTTSAFVFTPSALTTGTGLYTASSTLTSGLLVDLQVSGTAAAASQTALNILTAGANATNAITTYGAQISNTHTNVTSGTNVALYLNASGATTANYGVQVAAMTGATSTGLDIGNMSGATLNTGINIGTLGTATTSKGVVIGALSSATSTGVDIGALSGTTANIGVKVGAISGALGTGTGVTVGNISTTGTTNYGLQLGTMTGGTTANYQISTGTLTKITSSTNAQLNLGAVSGDATTSTNYGINLGAVSGTGTLNYGLHIGAVSGATTNISLAFAKENAHTMQIVDSTTANTAGGALTVKAGAGLGTTATAAGGAFTLQSGAGGALSATASTAGAGGLLSLTGGVGGATSGVITGSTVGGDGGALSLTAGVGGNAAGGTVANTGGAGGAITLTTGNAGTGGNANAGTLTLTTGTITGSGTATINLGTTNATAISIGRNGSTLTLASNGTSAWTNTSGNLTISTATSGTLALTSAGALNETNAAASTYSSVSNTAASYKITDGTNAYLTLDTRTTVSGVSALTFATGTAPTIASGASTYFNSSTFTPGIVNFSGSTQITSTGTSANNALLFNQPTINRTDAASSLIIDQASNLFINGPTIASHATVGQTETITSSAALRIGAGSTVAGTRGVVTNAYGLYVDVPTGATNNYAATFASGNVGIGTTSPNARLDINLSSDAGRLEVVSDAALLRLTRTSGGNAPDITMQSSEGTKGSETISLNGDRLLNLNGDGYNGAGYTTAGRIRMEVDGTPGASSMPGRILFSTTPSGSTALSERMRIDSNGNVGIGTTSPGGALSVVSSNATGTAASSSLSLTVNSLTSGEGIYASTSSITGGNLMHLKSTSTAMDSGTLLYVDSSGAMASSKSVYGVYSAVTNTGTTSTNIAGYFSASGATTNYGLVVPNGNVGIGTASPGGKLHIYSTSAAGGDLLYDTVGTGESDIYFRRARAGTTMVADNDWLFDIQGRGYQTDSNAYAGAVRISAQIDGTPASATDMPGRLSFWTTPDGSGTLAERVTIKNDGNVGIGTTGPGARLHVISDASASNVVDLQGKTLRIGGDDTNYTLRTDATSKQGFITVPHNTNAEESFLALAAQSDSTSNTMYLGGSTATYNAATTIRFYTAANNTTVTGTELMRLGSTGLSLGSSYVGTAAPSNGMIIEGNVGIGTTGPGSALEISSTSVTDWVPMLSVFNPSMANGNHAGRINIGTANSSGKSASMSFVPNATTSLSYLSFTHYGAANDQMVIQQSGNVGIGTTGPGAPLEIYKTNSAASSEFLRLTSSGTAFNTGEYISFYEGSTEVGRIESQDISGQGVPLKFYVYSGGLAEKMRITGDGNVGIGTTAPSALLSVGSTSQFQVSSAGAVTAVGVNYGSGALAGTGAFTLTSATNRIVIHDTSRETVVLSPTTGIGLYGAGGTAANTITLDLGGGAKFGSLSTKGYVCASQVTTDGTLTAGGASCASSDARLKTNITELSTQMDVLGALDKLKGVYFNWDLTNPVNAGENSARQVGMIAQDVEQVLPELVSYGSDGYRRLDYAKLTGYLVEVAKAQQAEINNLISQQATIANLTLDVDGSLVVPKLKTDKLVISADINFATSPTSSLLTMNYAPSTNNYNIDVLASLGSISEAILGVSTRESTTSAQLANLSAVIASDSAAISSHSSALTELQTNLASQSAKLAQTKSDVDNLKLTPPELLLATSSATLANLTVTSEASVSGKLTAYQATISDTFKALGNSFMGNTTIAGDLSIDGTMSITGNSINSIGCPSTIAQGDQCGILNIQNSNLATLVNFFNGLVTIDNKGTLTVQKLSVSNKTLSTATIPVGQTQVVVTTDQLTPTSKIFLSPHQPAAVAVIAKDPIAKTFTVELDHTSSSDLDIDWWVVDTR